MPSYTVTDSAAHVWNQYATQGASLFNNGPNVVYVGPDASVSTSNGVPVIAGQSVMLSATQDAWAVCASGQATGVSVAAGVASNAATVTTINGPVTVSGQVDLAPGSSVAVSGPVTVSGSVAITNADIPVSGTVTANIGAGSSVEITSGSVDIGQVNGNVSSASVNDVTLIGSPQSTVPAGASQSSYQQQILNTAGYASILLAIEYNAGLAAAPPDYANYIQITVQQLQGTTLVKEDYCEFLLCDATEQTFQVPVRGESATVTVSWKKQNATSGGGTLTALVMGSHEVISENRYSHIPNATYYVGTQGGAFYQHVNVGNTYASISRNGPATFLTLADSSTAGGHTDLYFAEAGLLYILGASGNLPAGGQVQQTVYLPQRPIWIGISPSGGYLDVALSQA